MARVSLSIGAGLLFVYGVVAPRALLLSPVAGR